MGKIRNAERTRKSILQAARGEFLEKGYAGTRIESIAQRAGVKKQLIYHYFSSKDQLIMETIEDLMSDAPPSGLVLPVNPAHIAEFRLDVNLKYLMDFLKFTAWEAIETFPSDLNGEERREKVLHSYNEDMRAKQEIGLVPKDLDPAFLTLMISSLTVYPLLFGNVTRMITGLTPDHPEFQEKWSHFLRLISERIFHDAKPNS
ncbi:TetR/AcrR family transcriptional regulator [Paenibacillus sp. VCA1]|uniref:TetR/AcrR family transcriptional regulator n=1 Tax=Paenibacillus sp. VCA1 TaxID=3039148 RepID=UPI002871FF26|nr:TetR/AcrR family transcriptional regulator [Paenibacillus sp. VCA1]MDR9855414.1 TetR/AcrR family transcriptional regulator [Paenibacillus sp. VCA1]